MAKMETVLRQTQIQTKETGASEAMPQQTNVAAALPHLVLKGFWVEQNVGAAIATESSRKHFKSQVPSPLVPIKGESESLKKNVSSV